jgi:glycosyltransferase involved in cell wall biosynthesis/SAM-dependent methyltransferase
MTSAPHQEPALDGLTPLRVGVVAPRRRLAWVRVLHESLAKHHPAATLTALVLDGVSEGEPFLQVTPDDVIEDAGRWHRLAMMLVHEELARALGPSLVRHLLATGDPVLLLGSDTLVRGPLDDLARMSREHGAALVPRRDSPLLYDGRRPDAADMAKLGAYDDAIVGVAGDGAAFAAWWERAAAGMWLDGREGAPIFDVAAAEFRHARVDDPAHGCARWNLDLPSRSAARARTLRLADFDPAQPHVLAARPGEAPRVLLSEHPDLAAICREHADDLKRHGNDVTECLPYGLDRLACGLERDDVARALYGEAVIFGNGRGDPELPDPYDPADADAFLAWLAEPVVRAADGFFVSRYLYEVYRCRGDLQALVPNLRAEAQPLVEWAHRYGVGELKIPLDVLPPPAPVTAGARASAAELDRSGVNVAGYFRSEFGIGEAARLLVDGLDAAAIPHATSTYTRVPIRHGHDFEERGGGHPYATNIVCVNVDRLEQFAYDAGPEFFAGRHTVGYWWWEAGVLPERLRPTLDIVDEVWVGSDYVRSLIAPVTEKPVLTMPVPIRIPSATRLPRAQLGMPEGFVFLFMFDFFSSIERKNPLGLIEAYRRAFGPDDGAALVLKSVNGENRLEELELLRAAASGMPDIVIIDRYVSAEERGAMMAACDCYASLHRSEGLGLTMAEAMALGKPVVATGWSGNLEFMSEETSYLVRHGMTTLERDHGPYPAGAEWAAPDLAHAAELMRRVFDDREAAAAVGERARRSIIEHHGTEPTAEFIRQRLRAIGNEVESRQVAPEADAPPEPPPAAARAQAWLATGLSESWAQESSLGPAGMHARRAMLRAIQPYTRRQAELDALLVEAAADAHGIIGDLLDRVASLEARAKDLYAFTADAERSLVELDERTRTLARAGGTTRVELTQLDQQLHAPPALSDPSLLRLRDEHGREAIGFEGGAGDDPAGVYLGFENMFRSDEEGVKELQRLYVDLLRGHGPVLDVGSGRGELLDLLVATGEPGRGVDSDEGMVALSRAKGHDVTLGDAISHLRTLEAGSLGAIFCAQLVEHLPYPELQAFLTESSRVLRPGGVFIAETVNPEPVQSFKAFWIDPTHETLLYPEVLLTLCRLAGFASGRVLFPGGTGDAMVDRRQTPAYAVVVRLAPE